MGRYGGRECSYASDADVIALHEPVGGASDSEAAASATAIVNRVKKLLGSATSQLGIVVDLDLRPEGKNGPMSRTRGVRAALGLHVGAPGCCARPAYRIERPR